MISDNTFEPPMFKNLLDQDSLQNFCQNFTSITGLTVNIIAYQGHQASLYWKPNKPLKYILEAIVAQLPQIKPAGNENDNFDASLYFLLGDLTFIIQTIKYDFDLLGFALFGPCLMARDLIPQKNIIELKDVDISLPDKIEIRSFQTEQIDSYCQNFSELMETLLFNAYKTFLTSNFHLQSIQDSYRELAKKTQEVEDAYEQLQELDKMKSNFVATISHELRTPLTSIIGYGEMITEEMIGPINERQKKYMGIIMEKSHALMIMINQLIELSRIVKKGYSLQLTEVDPSEIISTVLDSIGPVASKKQILIKRNRQCKQCNIIADKDKIKQMINHLIDNAIKFSPLESTIVINETVTMQETEPDDGNSPGTGSIFSLEKHYYCVEVQDQGVGIPDHLQEKIFDAFYQVNQNSTREFEGAGLGLCIVKNFVEMHKGKVVVESEVDKGSRFSILLPMEQENF